MSLDHVKFIPQSLTTSWFKLTKLSFGARETKDWILAVRSKIPSGYRHPTIYKPCLFLYYISNHNIMKCHQILGTWKNL